MGPKKNVVITQQELIDQQRRTTAGRLTILKISERMKARPERLKADARRRYRAWKRAKFLVKHKRMGIVNDEEFGAQPPRMSLAEARVKLC